MADVKTKKPKGHYVIHLDENFQVSKIQKKNKDDPNVYDEIDEPKPGFDGGAILNTITVIRTNPICVVDHMSGIRYCW